MSRQDDIKKLIINYHRRLQKLKEQQSLHGLDTAPAILIEIEDIEEKLETLQLTLRSIQNGIEPDIPAEIEQELPREKPHFSFEPKMVEIPAGSFLMGRHLGDDVPEEETPQHQVTLPEYKISKYPITNAQYAEFIKRTSQQKVPAGWVLRKPPANKLNHPVVGVSWHDAQAYCRWLNQETGRTYRLPTEAEWEKAASWAGEKKTWYPWGDEFDTKRANTSEAGVGDTTAVDTYLTMGDSAFGCTDMGGNVQEWTSTLWGSNLEKSDFPYPYQNNDGREDITLGYHLHRDLRVHRGGSFRENQTKTRTTARRASDSGSRISWRGFRVALES